MQRRVCSSMEITAVILPMRWILELEDHATMVLAVAACVEQFELLKEGRVELLCEEMSVERAARMAHRRCPTFESDGTNLSHLESRSKGGSSQ